MSHSQHATALATLPHRGRFGDARPDALSGLALPPSAMPGRFGSRPLKAWRYAGVFGPELMLCVANVRIELALDERPGVESVCVSGDGYGWTRKQGGVQARGTVTLPGAAPIPVDARAVIDDTAAYYERHTHWRWSAGVGDALDGRRLAWNLVEGVNDPASGSERTVWVDGEPSEPPPVRFDDDLSGVGQLRFEAEATRERHENRLLIRSRYRQPFGTFSGSLPGPGPIELAHGLGVMEDHEVWW